MVSIWIRDGVNTVLQGTTCRFGRVAEGVWKFDHTHGAWKFEMLQSFEPVVLQSLTIRDDIGERVLDIHFEGEIKEENKGSDFFEARASRWEESIGKYKLVVRKDWSNS